VYVTWISKHPNTPNDYQAHKVWKTYLR